MRVRIALAFLAAALGAQPAGARPAPPTAAADRPSTSGETIAAAVAAAQASLDRGAYAQTLEVLSPWSSPVALGKLPEDRRHDVLALAATAFIGSGDNRTAQALFKQATALPQATPLDWSYLMLAAISQADPADAWLAFQQVSKRDIATLTFADAATTIDRLARLFATLPNPAEARLALGQAFEQLPDRTDGPWNDDSWVRLDYAALLIDRGETDHGEAVARRIDNPLALAALRSDRRFDTIVARSPDLFDPDRAARRWVEKIDQFAATYSTSLNAELLRVTGRITANRLAEALTLVEAALVKARASSRASAGGFEDKVREGPMALYLKAWLLVAMGRGDEGSAIEDTLAASTGGPAYTLRAAAQRQSRGQADKALATAQSLKAEALIPTNAVALARVRACAAADAGEPAELARQLAILQSWRGFAPIDLFHALLCAGEADQAAIMAIEMLEDPLTRLKMLAALQVYAEKPEGRPGREALLAQKARLRQRPDVKQAIEAVGRIGSWNLLSVAGDL